MSDGGLARPIGAITFEPHLEERVWGGRSLERFGRRLPAGRPIGESWEISAMRGRSSRIARGPWKGSLLGDLLTRRRADVLGAGAPATPLFPVLVKLLDSRQALSVQLHPSDPEAVAIEGRREGSVGKTEAWIVLEAEPDAEIIHGLAPGVDPGDLWDRLEALGGRRLDVELERSLFRWRPVATGDVVFVPAGTVHALGAGIVLAEVQQSSDLTYRIYDWGRCGTDGKFRDLHIAKARRVALARDVRCPWRRVETAGGGDGADVLLECPLFCIESVRVGAGRRAAGRARAGREPAFEVLFGLAGAITWRGASGDEVEIERGRFVLVPACEAEYELVTGGEPALLLRFGPPALGG